LPKIQHENHLLAEHNEKVCLPSLPWPVHRYRCIEGWDAVAKNYAQSLLYKRSWQNKNLGHDVEWTKQPGDEGYSEMGWMQDKM
jgi:hypothetical protein